MSTTDLAFRQIGSCYQFRLIVPKDLQSFLGTKEFQLSSLVNPNSQAFSSHFIAFLNNFVSIEKGFWPFKNHHRSNYESCVQNSQVKPATPNPKSEEIKPSNNKKTTEISTTLTSSAISLSQLHPNSSMPKIKVAYLSKTINYSQFERSYLSTY